MTARRRGPRRSPTASRTRLALAVCACVAASAGLLHAQVVLTPEQIELAREFSPLPEPPRDPTNAAYENPAAAALGKTLFFDPRFSANGEVSCATCHDPDLGWGDGRRLAKGVANHPLHSMTLWNVAYNRWFFWDGRKDSLWSQALGPLEDPREHGSTRLQIAHALAADAELVRAYTDVFGAFPDLSDAARFPAVGRPVAEQPRHPHQLAWDTMSAHDQRTVNRVFVNFGKLLAAYQRGIVSRRAPFDVFVEGLDDGDPEKLTALSPSAQRGFLLFAGKAACHVCHDGPTFSDLEFHSNRVATGEGVDPGRALGVLKLEADPFNGASEFADDGGARAERKLQITPRGWHIPGEFKTPSLRNVALTAPYMHEGQIATLAEVVRFYSTLEGAAPPDPKGEKLIRAVDLSDEEQADLLAFLESLTDVSLTPQLRADVPVDTRADAPANAR